GLGAVLATAGIHCGAGSGLPAPNGTPQANGVRAALDSAGMAAADVDYVECHCTGTPLGDPSEVQALAAVYGQDRTPDRPLVLVSAKAVIGHLESAACIAGVCKVLAPFRHRALPAAVHST
ncbi:hypothetical protein VM98_35010, partial [Streptomyces rubellomurinus subsp. indigoferus]